MIEINSILDGKVTSVMPFGAFVSIDSDTSGLVHISELSKEYISDINDFIKKGDKVAIVSLSRGMLGEKMFIHKF